MSIIEQICGSYPEGFKKADILSDPNYVFVNDSNYATRQLFDSENNKVFVNSFIECEHYVSGGWGFNPLKNSELFYQELFMYAVIFGLFITLLKPKIIEFYKLNKIL